MSNHLRDRLKQARKSHPDGEMSQAALAKLAGISQTTVADIERGRNDGSKHIVALARALQCSVDWLAEGKGEMRPAPGHEGAKQETTTHSKRVMQPDLSPTEKHLIWGYRDCSNDGKLMIVEFVDYVHDKHGVHNGKVPKLIQAHPKRH